MRDTSFEEYLRESEPEKREKGYAWHTAIGLQAVDGLKASEYLIKTARRNIEGEITIEEAGKFRDYNITKKEWILVSRRTICNAKKLYMNYGTKSVFGRGDMIEVLGITESPASTLLKKLLLADLIEPVSGMGKGKYRFR